MTAIFHSFSEGIVSNAQDVGVTLMGRNFEIATGGGVRLVVMACAGGRVPAR